jgi:sugar phosphate permease
VDPGQTPVQLVPLTPAEKAFEAANSTSVGCTSATDPYCGATFAFWPGPVVADSARGRILFMYATIIVVILAVVVVAIGWTLVLRGRRRPRGTGTAPGGAGDPDLPL